MCLIRLYKENKISQSILDFIQKSKRNRGRRRRGESHLANIFPDVSTNSLSFMNENSCSSLGSA